MRSLVSRSISPLFLFALVLLSPVASAQITGVNNATSTPVPGIGHDYIKMLNETVNPANGSVSLRIAVPTPPGRGLTVPFSFAYDSNGVYTPFGEGDANGTVDMQITSQYLLTDGWSYTVPMATNQDVNIGVQPARGVWCQASTGYVFQDAGGARNSFGLIGYNLHDPDCTSKGVHSKQYAATDFYQATISGSSGAWNGGLSVVDADGRVYKFGGFGFFSAGGCSFQDSGSAQIPSSIEDRNGNLITITVPASPNNCNGQFTVMDTLGRTLLSSSGFGATGNTVTVSGLPQPYTVTWGTAPVNFTPGATFLGGSGCSSTFSHDQGSIPVITAITLPNGQEYQFSYDATYGLLSKVIYPSRGYISYTWAPNSRSEFAALTGPNNAPQICDYEYDSAAISHRYVSYDGVTIAEQQDFNYSTTWNPNVFGAWSTKQTTVTAHDLIRNTSFQTTYTYLPVNAPQVPGLWNTYASQIPLEQTIVYKDTNGNTLRTVNKTWFDQYELKSQQTVLENNLTSETDYTYGAGAQVTEQDDYDVGSGARGGLLRKTITNYQAFNATPIFSSAASILDRPCQTIIYDSSGTNRVAETDDLYDGGATVCGAAGTPSVSGVSNLPAGTHDETNYGPSSTAPRANLTKAVKQCFQGSQACASGNPTTTFTYDEAGQVLTSVDPCGNASCSDMPPGASHTTSFSYADVYSPCGGAAPPSGSSDAYLTRITDPLGHTQNFCYGYNDGQLRSSTDENSQTATYKYNDNLGRLTETDYPDGGKTSLTYNDSPYNPSTPSPSVTATRAINSSTNLSMLTAYDGLGHTVRSVLTSDSDCVNGDRTDTTYDGLGRVYTVSNPYCSTSDSTYGLTTYIYDTLGRVTQVTHPDNSTILTTYTGRATQVQDEGNGTQRDVRISQSDGLGRLTAVCEVSNASLIGSSGTPAACAQDIAATGFLTTHQYDALDNLLQVNQSGIGARTFVYDSLSRLKSASNPESGTTSYAYDANSNIYTKTDARNITTTYAYEPLNRLTGKTFSDNTPAVTFNYDQSSARGVTLTNTIGRKSSESTTGSLPTGSVFSYDSMGRLKDNSQCTPQNCGTGVFGIQYTQYDFLGDLLSGTSAPTGVTFSYSYNTAGRLTGISSNFVDPSHPGTLFSQATYNAPGLLKSVLLGNNLTETRNYNSRLLLTSLAAGSAYSLNMTSYAPNGDVLAASDSINGNWTYSYDPFNRLAGSNQNSGQAIYSYVYDRFGNRWQQNGPRPFVATFTGNNPGNPQNNNRMDGYSYDAAGNLLNDGTHNYSYDAENRLITVDNGTTASYVYDAEGRRVRKATPSGTLDFLYDAQGHKVAEIDATGIPQRGELYAGDRHFAVYAPDPGPTGATFFIHADWLATERARTNMSGTACETITSLPFGDGQTISDNCGDSAGDVSPMHFTGKERDSESGLDNFGARYDSSSIGRFMSPDPLMASATVRDPQTWNRYTYALNNPLRYIDPTGMTEENAADCQNDKKCVTVKVNVIYDQNANLTDKQKETFNKQLLQEAKDEYGDAHIHLDVTYTAGGYDDKGNIQGLSKDSINVIVSDWAPEGDTSASQVNQAGYALTQININTAGKGDLAHELAHDFLGDNTGLISRIAKRDESGIVGAVANAAFDVVNYGMRQAMKNPSPYVRSSMIAPEIFNSGAKQFQQMLTQQAAIRPRQQ